MRKSTLNARLLSAADFVRQGASFADVGTDHAYLPLFLLEEGRISRAVCSDINKGPLDSARRNADERGLADRIEFVLTDGAAALSDRGITDYAICGMGGELIAEIVGKAPHLRSPDINLILQPMSKQAHLRKYLLSQGYRIVAERYSFDGGKYYVTLNAKHLGEPLFISDTEAEIGLSGFAECDREAHVGYLRSRITPLLKSARGKELSGKVGVERKTVAQIVELLASVGENININEFI